MQGELHVDHLALSGKLKPKIRRVGDGSKALAKLPDFFVAVTCVDVDAAEYLCYYFDCYRHRY